MASVTTRYQDPTSRKRRLLIPLAFATLFALAFSISSLYEWFVLAEYPPETTPGELRSDTVETLGFLSLVIILPRIIFLLATAVFFLIWIYRIHENAYALQLEGSIYTPGWAVSFYLIPFVNFFLPLVSTLQLTKAQANALNRKSNKGTIVIWWLLFLFSMLIAASRGFFTEEGATVQMLRNDALMTSISEFTLFLAGCLAWIIIVRISNQQIAIQNKE
ncbi:hypothetical protein HNR44_000356 [Geomicrobium halophilum]|uniref:DUF4328 domain-containing protein n=1 Tax=Geomicrobium halophilum TaxID=549000 RepID=A0A841PHP4_9BACL|nr:DUF4328 domain-containing protein [Geomicrobium halophilum]MBB6448407.1 hypothetical protein [Geomicrobium halophilum]